VKIGAGVRIKNSLILSGVEIKDRACILNSIIGWGSVLGQWCRIEGDPNNITILGEQVSVSPEVVIRNSIVLPHKVLAKNHSNTILL
jgi:mannose-1-phosphate guanylyltransferase